MKIQYYLCLLLIGLQLGLNLKTFFAVFVLPPFTTITRIRPQTVDTGPVVLTRE